MNTQVRRHLRVKAGHQHPSLAGQHRILAAAGQNLNPRSGGGDAWCPDEHQRQRPFFRSGQLRIHPLGVALERIQLAAVGIPRHLDIHEPQAALLRPAHPAGQQDKTGTGAEEGAPGLGKGTQCLLESVRLHEPEQCAALAPGQDQAAQPGQFLRLAHFTGGHAAGRQHAGVGRVVPLQGQNADGWFRRHGSAAGPFRPGHGCPVPAWLR